MLEKQRKQKEENLFLEQMKIDVEAENEIRTIKGLDGLVVKTTPMFKVNVK